MAPEGKQRRYTVRPVLFSREAPLEFDGAGNVVSAHENHLVPDIITDRLDGTEDSPMTVREVRPPREMTRQKCLLWEVLTDRHLEKEQRNEGKDPRKRRKRSGIPGQREYSGMIVRQVKGRYEYSSDGKRFPECLDKVDARTGGIAITTALLAVLQEEGLAYIPPRPQKSSRGRQEGRLPLPVEYDRDLLDRLNRTSKPRQMRDCQEPAHSQEPPQHEVEVSANLKTGQLEYKGPHGPAFQEFTRTMALLKSEGETALPEPTPSPEDRITVLAVVGHAFQHLGKEAVHVRDFVEGILDGTRVDELDSYVDQLFRVLPEAIERLHGQGWTLDEPVDQSPASLNVLRFVRVDHGAA